MIPLAVDEDFDNRVVRGLLRRRPGLNLVRVQDVGLLGAEDGAILEWVAREGRVLLTHDVRTMTRHAYDRVRKGKPMPGVFEVGRWIPIGRVIGDLLILAECSRPGEWEGQIRYLPL